MTVRDALQYGSSLLKVKQIDTPFLDTVVLLAYALSIPKEKLYASYPEQLPEKSFNIFRELLEKRLSGLPVSYIRKKKEFFGMEFYVDERVLVPRPETETLVETALEILSQKPWMLKMHDVCTGTGCIAITVKKSIGDIHISASDISPDAERVFKLNCRNILGEVLPFYKSDLLTEVPGSFDMIIANPPYLSKGEISDMKNAGWPEPEIALFGGEEGYELSERLIRQVVDYLNEDGYLLIEASASQMPVLESIFKQTGYYDIEIKKDLAGRDRVIAGRR